MGYKLAGCEVVGGVEIDPEMMGIYRRNWQPPHSFLMGVQEFNKLPEERRAPMIGIDILDGSPPCSSFSTAGARSKKWGETHKFREGQAEQELDSLFFDFIKTARLLRPRVVVAENVSGLIKGAARGYVKEIFKGFQDAGYSVQLFLLNAAAMGVPQRRQRTFFVARRNDLGFKPLKLAFSETPVVVSEAFEGVSAYPRHSGLSEARLGYWERVKPGENFGKVHPKGSLFSTAKLHPGRSAPTLTATCKVNALHWSEPRGITGGEAIRLQTFPDDYLVTENRVHYVVGMSVPPFMMQRVVLEIRKQWLG